MDDTKPTSSSSVPSNLPLAPTNQPNPTGRPSTLSTSPISPPTIRPPQSSPPPPPLRIDSFSVPKVQTIPNPLPRPTPPSVTPASPIRPPIPAPAKAPAQQSPSVPLFKPSSTASPLPVTPPFSKPTVPAPTATGDVSLKSSIRTMQDDLAAIKKGQVPIGIELQKSNIGLPPKPVQPTTSARPTIPTPLKPSIHVELGKTQIAKPLNQPGIPAPLTPHKGLSATLPGMTSSGVSIPRGTNTVGRKNLYLLIIGVLIVLGVGGYFVYGHYFSATPTPVATSSTPTPTPPLSELEKIFGTPGLINIATGTDPYLAIQSSTSQTGNPGEISFYNVTSESGTRFGFSNLLTRLIISHPPALDVLNNPEGFLLGAGSPSVTTNKKNLAMIVTVSDAQGATAAMKVWESTISDDLKTLFGIDPKKKSSKVFLDNSYQGVAVRYMNFPDANLTIDYAVISTSSGSNFLVIASSKALMYSLIDILVNSQPSPTVAQ